MTSPQNYRPSRRRSAASRSIAVVLVLAIASGLGAVAPSAALAADASIAVNAATLSPGQASTTVLAGSSPDKAEALFSVGVGSLAASSSAYVGTRVRANGNTFYLLQARVMPDGGVLVALKRSVGGVVTDLVQSTRTTVRASSASEISVSLEASSLSDVALFGIVQAAGVSHRVEFTDQSDSRITRAGASFAWRYLSGGATSPVSIGMREYAGATVINPDAVNLPAGQSKVVKISESSDSAGAHFAVGSGAAIPTYVGLRVRASGQSFYLFQAKVLPDRRIFTVVKRSIGGTTLDLESTRDSGLVLPDGGSLALKLSASGDRAVGLSASVGIAGSNNTVAITSTDPSSDRLPRTSGALAWAFAGSGVGSSSVTITPDGASPLPPAPPAPAPTPPASLPPATPPGGVVGPNEKTTGVPAGVKLKVHEGDLVVRTANATIEGLEVRGFITIAAPGVTIKNTKVVGRPVSVPAALVTNHSTGSSFSIIDSELVAAKPSPYINGIMGKNFTAERVNIHGVMDGIRITGSDVRVSASWIHDHLHYESDPNFDGSPSHDDSIQIQAGRNITIVGNRTEDAWNASVQVTQGIGTVSNLTIANNFMQDGSCTINISESGGSAISGAIVKNNIFGSDRRIKACAVYGPPTTRIVLQGNSWADGSTTPITQKWW